MMNKNLQLYTYTTVFFVGATVLLMEILGTRVISPFYGATVFVWTSLIAVTLGALAFGYMVGGKVADRRPDPTLFFSLVAIAGLLYFLPVKIDQWALPVTDPLGLRWGPLVSALLLFSPPLMLLGMITPFAIRILIKNVEASGQTAGRVFALATVGSIIGSLVTGFYILEALSLTQSFSFAGFLLVSLGAAGVVFSSGKKKLDPIIILVALALLIQQLPAHLYEDTYTLKIHRHEQSFYADLKVMEIGVFKCLAMNGSLQSCMNLREGRPTFTFIAETERITRERKPKTMLLLGLGTGNVLHNLPHDLEVDVVELDPRLVPISREYFGLQEDQYSRLIIDDARHFLETNKKQYDLVLIDTFLGSNLPLHMFTQEAMETWRTAVGSGGLLLVNMEGKLGDEDVQIQTIMKTLKSVFPTTRLTTTEPDRFTSVLIHASSDPGYVFSPGGQFVERPIDTSNAYVMTDDHNRLEAISIKKLGIFRDEMINVGGMKLLFSSVSSAQL